MSLSSFQCLVSKTNAYKAVDGSTTKVTDLAKGEMSIISEVAQVTPANLAALKGKGFYIVLGTGTNNPIFSYLIHPNRTLIARKSLYSAPQNKLVTLTFSAVSGIVAPKTLAVHIQPKENPNVLIDDLRRFSFYVELSNASYTAQEVRDLVYAEMLKSFSNTTIKKNSFLDDRLTIATSSTDKITITAKSLTQLTIHDYAVVDFDVLVLDSRDEKPFTGVTNVVTTATFYGVGYWKQIHDFQLRAFTYLGLRNRMAYPNDSYLGYEEDLVTSSDVGFNTIYLTGRTEPNIKNVEGIHQSQFEIMLAFQKDAEPIDPNPAFVDTANVAISETGESLLNNLLGGIM